MHEVVGGNEDVGGNEAEAEGEDGAEAEDEEEGEGNYEAGGMEGGEGTEEQMPLHIYRITTDDESHCLGVVLIEECEDFHELHEKVLDVIFENGDLEEYETPSIEEYTVLYLQLNGDSFLRLKPEIPWGVFRHLVDQVSSFDGTLLDIYRRTEDEETELVGWKGVRIEDCNGNIEALDEMVRNYFSVHGDIDASTLIYYTKLRNGFDRELSLEIEWDVFTHLVRGVVAVSEDTWSEFEWLDGDERYIDWKLKKEDGVLVSLCRITIDGERHSLGDILFDSEINQVQDLCRKVKEHMRLYHEVEGYVNPENIDDYYLRYCTILDSGAERHMKFPNIDIGLNEFIHMLKIIIVCDRDPGDQFE